MPYSHCLDSFFVREKDQGYYARRLGITKNPFDLLFALLYNYDLFPANSTLAANSLGGHRLFMTYCFAAHVNDGLVLCSDSRTNAGVDNVGVYSKMRSFCWPGDRFLCLLSSGNLATTQGVVKKVQQDLEDNAEKNLLNLPSMSEIADYLGHVNTEIQNKQANREESGDNVAATFIIGGQIGSDNPAVYLVYPQGNYIYEAPDHPFLQLGEMKYGKPIADRVIRPDLPLESTARCALVSMNSTIRSNVSVGAPVELLIYTANSLQPGRYLSFSEDNDFFKTMDARWCRGLEAALNDLPLFDWEN